MGETIQTRYKKSEILDLLRQYYAENKLQSEIAANFNQLGIQSPMPGKAWDDKYVSSFALKNGLRRHSQRPRRASEVTREGSRKSEISLTTLGKLLQAEGLSDAEKRALLGALT